MGIAFTCSMLQGYNHASTMVTACSLSKKDYFNKWYKKSPSRSSDWSAEVRNSVLWQD